MTWPTRFQEVAIAATLALGALPACDSSPVRARADRPGRPAERRSAARLEASRSAAPRPVAPHRPTPRGVRTRRPRASAPSWRVNPDARLPDPSPWRPVLAVARRFAAADMSYEVGELGPAVRWAITRTCTARFAAELLSQRPSLPPGVSVRQVRQQLVGLAPLERLAGTAVVLATVRPAGRGGAPGAFELGLVPRHGGWRVAAMSVL